ncbi:MAG TPA: TIM barrel protein [bacterium]|nr:TIM barrel protein [bacterium]
MKLAALIDLFFTDKSWEKRVVEIAGCGYRYIETWQGGDAKVLQQMNSAGKDCGVSLVSIVMNHVGDKDTAPINRENKSRFAERIDRFSDNALSAGCTQGIVTTGNSISGHDYQSQRAALVEALRAAGELAKTKGFTLNLEPLNTEVDHPGYFLDCPVEGVAIVKETGLDNVRILYDFYHMAIMTGNQASFIEHNIKWIGHFHIAGIPGRNEPITGELYYPFMLAVSLNAGYDRYFGLEYKPLIACPETLIKTLSYLKGNE